VQTLHGSNVIGVSLHLEPGSGIASELVLQSIGSHAIWDPIIKYHNEHLAEEKWANDQMVPGQAHHGAFQHNYTCQLCQK